MAMTRLEMATRANHMTGNRDTSLDEARRWVDRTYREVQTMRDHRILRVSTAITLVVGDRDYPLPADYRSTRRVFNETRGTKIKLKTPERFGELWPTSKQNPPLYYTVMEGQLWFWPTPSDPDIVRFRYRRNLATLTDNDAHLLDPEWDDVIILGAAARGCDYFNEHERATELRRAQRLAASLIEDPEALDLLDLDEPVEVLR